MVCITGKIKKLLYRMRKLLLLLTAFACCTSQLIAQVNGGKKILIVATNSDKDLKYGSGGWGCYMPEITDFYSTIYKHGFRTEDFDIVSPLGGKVPVIADQQIDWQLQLPAGEETKIRAKIANSLKPSQVDVSKYNVIYYAGGYSCLVDIPTNNEIAGIATKIYEAGGVIGLVCDGIVGLIPIKLSNGKYLVDGKRLVTNGYDMNVDGMDVDGTLTGNGGNIDLTKELVVDSRIVTGRGVQPIEVAQEIMALLGLGRFPTSINEVTAEVKFQCYPNPARTAVRLNLPSQINSDIITYSINNMLGSTVLSGTVNISGEISLNSMRPGIYSIKAATGGKEYQTMLWID